MRPGASVLAVVFLFASLAIGETPFTSQSPPLPRATLSAQTPGDAPSFRVQPPSEGVQKDARGYSYVADHLLVRFKPGVPQAFKEYANTMVQAQVLREYTSVDNLQLVRLPAGMSVEQAITTYRDNPDVLYAEPDYLQYADTTPNDPSYSSLWGLKNTGQTGGTSGVDIDAELAWNTTTGSSSVYVMGIDTGIDYNHPDLAANMAQLESNCSDGIDNNGDGYVDDCRGIDTVNGDTDPMDDNDHGTHTAGTIGAVGNNSIGVVGVNWTVRLIACKFLGSNGTGATSGAITCLDFAKTLKQNGLNLIATSNSWAGGGTGQALFDAIEAQKGQGILFIAAAGNGGFDGIGDDNDTVPNFPSNYFVPNVIAVAATDASDNRASFSNFGQRTVHLGAPGVGILSTTRNNTYSTFDGTSMATPHVTGVAALLKAADNNRDWKAIKNLILSGGDTTVAMTGNTITGRRLNANGALSCSNSVVLSRLRPIGSTVGLATNSTLLLAAEHINCANPNGNVTVTVSPGNTQVTLMDDGVAPDEESGDGIYTAIWVPSVAQAYTLTFPNADVVNVNVATSYNAATTTTYSYRDITATGTNLNFGGVGDVGQITSPFPINFAGNTLQTLTIGSNGWITFDSPAPTNGVGFYINSALPFSTFNTMIDPWWDALRVIPGTQQNVFWAVIGSQPSRELVIEWRDVEQRFCTAGDTIKFQVILFENSSNILFNYADTHFTGPCLINLFNPHQPDHGASATVGVQVISQVATQFSFNTPSLSDNMALLWTFDSTVPLVTSVFPNTIPAGSSAFTLTVNGSGFLNGVSVVRLNGVDKTTTFVNSTQLTASIPAADVATVGTKQVTVFNPAPGGGLSNALTFTVSLRNPLPTVTSVSPSGAVAGAAGFMLGVNGSNFVFDSTVQWDGAPRTTTFLNSNQLQALIPASDLEVADVGAHQVTVMSPGPGGGTSNAVNFSVQNAPNPAPTLTSLIPDSETAGAVRTSLLVMVTGTNFAPNSVLRWNGMNRITSFVDTGHLTVTIPASDLAAAGTAQVTVFTPTPGGGTSNALPFTVNNPAPILSSLSPNSAAAGGPAFTLTVVGSNFLPGSVVRWSGSNRPTTFIGNNQLRAAIPDSDIASVVPINVTVSNPTPGGGESALQSFTINSAAQARVAAATPTMQPQQAVSSRPEPAPAVLVAPLGSSVRASAPIVERLQPAFVVAGSRTLTLRVRGENFTEQSVLQLRGKDLPTKFVSETELEVEIPASALAQPGELKLTVFTPGPAGGTSKPATLQVQAP